MTVGVSIVVAVLVPVIVWLGLKGLRLTARTLRIELPPCPRCGALIDTGMDRKPARPVLYAVTALAASFLVIGSVFTCVFGAAVAADDAVVKGPQWYVPAFLATLAMVAAGVRLFIALHRPPVTSHERCGYRRTA